MALSHLQAMSVMQQEPVLGSCDAGNDFPLSQCRSAMDLHMASRDQMALKVEGVIDGGVYGEKSLRWARVLEADPTSFSSSNRLM